MTKELLRNKTDIDTIIARYMFEKFGTLPDTVVEMDDYQKGVIFAFLEDIVEVAETQRKNAERDAKLKQRKRR